mmetsp:Transcript_12076/g.27999  ORF Transcript_12076/g.27999 Transcript_12076/m.27999 type:complete len:185 (-) Transcript_12076:183-737(-)
MSFCCFVPGQPMIRASAFTQVAPNRWSVTLSSERPIGELVAFITEPLAEGSAVGCHIASAPFEEQSWHYLGAITNEAPSTVFKTRLVWSARDAVPTCVQFGVELQPASQLAHVPAEKASVEVLEAGRRVGLDLYEYISSFASTVTTATGNSAIQLPSNVLEKWLTRFNDKVRREGLDWLSSVGS